MIGELLIKKYTRECEDIIVGSNNQLSKESIERIAFLKELIEHLKLLVEANVPYFMYRIFSDEKYKDILRKDVYMYADYIEENYPEEFKKGNENVSEHYLDML